LLGKRVNEYASSALAKPPRPTFSGTRVERALHALAFAAFAVFSSLFLPFGLFYAHLFAPVALFFIAKWRYQGIEWLFGVALLFACYSLALSFNTVLQLGDFLVSSLIFFAGVIYATYIFYLVAYKILNFRRLLSWVLYVNLLLATLALTALVSGYGDCCWVPADYGNVPRLKLGFLEPSHLAYNLVPFVMYAAVDFIYTDGKRSSWCFVIGMTLLGLTQSLSVIGLFIASLSLAVLPVWRSALSKSRALVAIVCLAGLILFSLSGLSERIQVSLQGGDHSGKVRVVYSMFVATDLLDDQDAWLLGVGVGQPKFFIEAYALSYPGYVSNRLPNSIASTLAAVGVVGLTVKLLAFLILFVRTHSFRYSFSRGLFAFAFFYQFAGGYFNNVNELTSFAIALGYGMMRWTADPQRGLDHKPGHRAICTVAGPHSGPYRSRCYRRVRCADRSRPAGTMIKARSVAEATTHNCQ